MPSLVAERGPHIRSTLRGNPGPAVSGAQSGCVMGRSVRLLASEASRASVDKPVDNPVDKPPTRVAMARKSARVCPDRSGELAPVTWGAAAVVSPARTKKLLANVVPATQRGRGDAARGQAERSASQSRDEAALSAARA